MTDIDLAQDERIVAWRRRYNHARLALVLLSGFLAVLFSAGMAFMMVQTYQSQKTVEGCQVPGQSCYEQRQVILNRALERLERTIEQQTASSRENLRVSQDNRNRLAQLEQRLDQRPTK